VLSPSIYLVEATSGLEAIYFFELLNKAKCQIMLILLDINMGAKEIDGYETASRIRE
jgi:CheY-like chemotaxis protein